MRVFAAASLREAFEEIGRAHESAGGGEVQFNFAGSQLLRFQLDQGAQADIFASADELQMRLAREAGLVGESTAFARNRLVVVTPDDNPKGVTGPPDLARRGLRLVLAAPEVPAGGYSRDAIEALASIYGADFARRTLANVVSEEEDVERVLTKVRLGEADAGIVYASDIVGKGGGGVAAFPFPDSVQPDIIYYIAPLLDGDSGAARAFIAALLSPAGRAALAAKGIEPLP